VDHAEKTEKKEKYRENLKRVFSRVYGHVGGNYWIIYFEFKKNLLVNIYGFILFF